MTPGITVIVTAVPPRVASGMLANALASVWVQERLPEAVVVVIDTAGEGEAPTRNRGIAAVRTEWLAFLDDDDVLYPNHLAVLEAASEGVSLVYPWFDVEGGTDPLGAEGQPFDRERLEHRGNYIPVTYLLRTELAQSVGGFPLPHSEDWPHPGSVDWGFHKRLLKAGARYHHVPERTWQWRHGGHTHAQGRPWPAWG
jgi:glycosyltransferase involved in cell wall biosynthesis